MNGKLKNAEPNSDRKKRYPIISFCLLGISVIFCWWGFDSIHDADPILQFPIDLKQSSNTSPAFRAKRNANYRLLIETDDAHNKQEVSCLLGTDIEPAKNCASLNSLVDITWTIYTPEKQIERGKSNDGKWTHWSPTDRQKAIGEVPLMRGTEYKLELQAAIDMSALKQWNPRVVIALPPLAADSVSLAFVGFFLVAFLFAVPGFVGVIYWATTRSSDSSS